MQTKNIVVAIAFAGLALSSGAIVDTFETGSSNGWTGGTIAVGAETPAKPAYGYPVATAAHENTMSVSGEAVRSVSGSGADSIDSMMKVAIPSENPDADSMARGARFAVVAWSDGTLRCYCKTSPEAPAGFVSLGAATYADGDWVRITVAIDYALSRFRLALDGVEQPQLYYLAGDGVSIEAVDVIGQTALDDFVAKSGYSAYYDKFEAVNENGTPAAYVAGGIAVPHNYLGYYGYATSSEGAGTRIANSALSVAEAYQVGVEPTDGASFAIRSFAMGGTSAEPNFTITFNGGWPVESYDLVYGSVVTSLEDSVPDSNYISRSKESDLNRVTVRLDGLDPANVFFCRVAR